MGASKTSLENERMLCDEIIKTIREIRYGEVVVSIHDSEVVQIEKREKKRFSQNVTEKSEH